jgi:hypothetical protein
MMPMFHKLIFTLTLLLVFAATVLGQAEPVSRAFIPPLDQSQLTRLETTHQGSRTIDEAAFYALLENAAKWPSGATPDDVRDDDVILATAPKVEQIVQNPAERQGQLVLIEGALEGVMPPARLARSGWEQIEGLLIRPEGGKPVIVYVTNPPALTRDKEGSQYITQLHSKVKVLARFFKVVQDRNREGETTLYPVFVGNSVADFQADTTSVPKGLGVIPLAALGIAGCIFLLYYRLRRMGGGTTGAGHLTLEEYKQRKLQRAQATESPEEDAAETQEPPIDLPEDPADALEALKHHQKEADRR